MISATFLLNMPQNMWCSGKQSLTALNASQQLYAWSPQERDLSRRILTSSDPQNRELFWHVVQLQP